MGGCDPIIDGVAGGAAAGVEPRILDRRQYQGSLADIAARSVPTPIGFWDLNRVGTERVTGGAGYDLVRPGVSGNNAAYSFVDGEIGVDDVYAGYWNGVSMGEIDNLAVWRLGSLDSDMSLSCFVRPNSYDGSALTQEQGVLSFAHRSSGTLGATTYPTYLLWMDPLESNQSYQPRFGYYDSGGALVDMGWETAGNDPIGLRLSGWYHLGATRTRNGLNDNDLRLYVNGRLVASLDAQNDTGSPDSANMRLLFGARIASSDEFQGSIRDVTIWDEAISATNMLEMWRMGLGITA